jgi:hypothetical protein
MKNMLKKTAADRYKEQGLQQFTCWLHPDTILKIKMMAQLHELKIPDVITAKFQDVEIKRESSKGKLTVRFSKVEETTEEISI